MKPVGRLGSAREEPQYTTTVAGSARSPFLCSATLAARAATRSMRQDIIQRALEHREPAGAGQADPAEASARALDALFSELEPFVGVEGTRALLARCVHLTRSTFQWPSAGQLMPRDDLLRVFREHLAATGPADARRAGEALLNAFADLLVSLIGEPLTLRLLQSAWGGPAAGEPTLENIE